MWRPFWKMADTGALPQMGNLHHENVFLHIDTIPMTYHTPYHHKEPTGIYFKQYTVKFLRKASDGSPTIECWTIAIVFFDFAPEVPRCFFIFDFSASGLAAVAFDPVARLVAFLQTQVFPLVSRQLMQGAMPKWSDRRPLAYWAKYRVLYIYICVSQCSAALIIKYI